MKPKTLLSAIVAVALGALLYFHLRPEAVSSLPTKLAPVAPAKAPAPPLASRVTPSVAPPSIPAAVPVPESSPTIPTAPRTASSPNLTPAEKALLTRQALAARGPAPKFSSTPALPPANLTPLEQRVVDLLAGAPSSIRINELEIFELDPGTTSSYHLRSDVVKIPIPGNGSSFDTHDHVIYYLPSANHFYIVWEGLGASTLHYRGPFEGNPYEILGITPPDNPRP